jgi:hypothetical protein
MNTSTCGGIEPLKLAFLAQVAYDVNQVSIRFQLHKLIQEEKLLQLESRKLVESKTTIKFNKWNNTLKRAKKLCLYKNIACNSTNHKFFCCCRNIINNSTKQLQLNHQSNSDVVLLSTTQYIQHRGNSPKCKIVVQTCAQ